MASQSNSPHVRARNECLLLTRTDAWLGQPGRRRGRQLLFCEEDDYREAAGARGSGTAAVGEARLYVV